MTDLIPAQLLQDIRQILTAARQNFVKTVNSAMVQTYWQVGRLIIEHEQHGKSRAEYGTQQLEQLAQQLTEEFGKGFEARNLRNMRRFYTVYPIWNAVRTELSWTHYRILIRPDNPKTRARYVTCFKPNTRVLGHNQTEC